MTGLIILAAGSWVRLGQPKQNLLFQNKILLQRAIETGLKSECRPIILVLGANTDLIDHGIEDKDVTDHQIWQYSIKTSPFSMYLC